MGKPLAGIDSVNRELHAASLAFERIRESLWDALGIDVAPGLDHKAYIDAIDAAEEWTEVLASAGVDLSPDADEGDETRVPGLDHAAYSAAFDADEERRERIEAKARDLAPRIRAVARTAEMKALMYAPVYSAVDEGLGELRGYVDEQFEQLKGDIAEVVSEMRELLRKAKPPCGRV